MQDAGAASVEGLGVFDRSMDPFSPVVGQRERAEEGTAGAERVGGRADVVDHVVANQWA